MRDDPDDGVAAARVLLPDWRFEGGEAVSGGSERSVVHRVRGEPPGGGTASLIVKRYHGEGEGWARERAALATLAGAGAAPTLIAAGREPPALVFDDLGDGPNVADALLGDDFETARHAVVRWAEAVADLHAAARGQRAAFGAQLEQHAGDVAIDESRTWVGLDDAVRVLDGACGSLGVAVPGTALDDLRELAHRLGGDGAASLTPADTCPDNNVYVGDRLVLIDFEGAQWRHIAWDVAYLRVPWPTCWCSWRIPEDVADEAVAAYRAGAATAFPEVEQDGFAADVEAAAVAWAFMSTTWFLGHALGEDQPIDAQEQTPTRRASILHRLDGAATCTELPALAELALNLTRELRGRWGDVPLALAPAFRG